ncbi:MAG: GntR family transcriptional regulator, partial [Kiritimatiellae bacterium]|nr:GntR family transcriptional regulator [Kiritimatiellia bacterium]
LAQKLRQDIMAGKWSVERPLPSERTISKQFNVSRITARRCLQMLLREGLIVARPGRGYFPIHHIATSPSAHLRRAIIYHYATDAGRPTLDPKHASIINGANTECLRLGLNLYAVSRSPNHVLRALGDNWHETVRGVLLDWPTLNMAEELQTRNIPFVIVEDDLERPEMPVVIQDDVGGAFQALSHILERGHRRIGILVNNINNVHPRRRLAAYKEFLLRHDLPFQPHWMQISPPQEGEKAMAKILEGGERPTAVFVASGGLLPGVLAELSRRGIRCPQDISLVLWGDSGLEGNGFGAPSITCVTWDGEEMGRLAVRLLEHVIQSGPTPRMVVRVPTQLIEGRSVAHLQRYEATG